MPINFFKIMSLRPEIVLYFFEESSLKLNLILNFFSIEKLKLISSKESKCPLSMKLKLFKSFKNFFSIGLFFLIVLLNIL